MSDITTFQPRTFQIGTFQVSQAVTDTTILYQPIDAVLAGQQDYEFSVKTWDVKDPSIRVRVVVETGGVKKLGGDSTYSTKTNNRGYD